MDYKNFEESMQSKLRNAEEYVDTAALIQAIHPLEEKKRWGLWYALTGILLLTIIPTYLYLGHNENIAISEASFSKIDADLIEKKPDDYHTIIDKKIAEANHSTPLSYAIKAKTNRSLTNNNYSENTIEKNTKTVIPVDQQEFIHPTTLKQQTNIVKYNHKNSFQQLDVKKLELLSVNQNINLPTKNYPTVECPSFNGPTWRSSIGIHGGAFYPIKKLTDSNIESNSIFTDRLQNEKSLEGLNAGLFFQVEHIKLPLYLKFGVDYSKLTEKLSLETSITKMDTVQGIISITESQNGDTLTVIRGDIITEKTIQTKSVTHYSIQMVDLPIHLGYRFKMKNFNIALEPGVCINLLTKVKGKILNEIDIINPISDNNNFNKKIGLSFLGNLIFEKPLNFGALSLHLKYRFIPADFSTTNISQHYSFLGANLGYRIDF